MYNLGERQDMLEYNKYTEVFVLHYQSATCAYGKSKTNTEDFGCETQSADQPGLPSSLTAQSHLLFTAFIFRSSGSYDLGTKNCVY